ncbi:MAG: hypothetical protein K9J13_14715 [Saprospiraceae bacterium]|nr:hypothetical protein [Saprospiraceae bacterium]
MFEIDDGKIKYRAFKTPPIFKIFTAREESKVFKIQNNLVHIILVLWYSFLALTLGWIGGSSHIIFGTIKNVLETLHINMAGGIDYSKTQNETEYDYETNYVWNNLLSKTRNKINKYEVETILLIQDEFKKMNREFYTNDNIDFIIYNLGKIDIHRIRKDEILDIFDALKLYSNHEIEEDYV